MPRAASACADYPAGAAVAPIQCGLAWTPSLQPLAKGLVKQLEGRSGPWPSFPKQVPADHLTCLQVSGPRQHFLQEPRKALTSTGSWCQACAQSLPEPPGAEGKDLVPVITPSAESALSAGEGWLAAALVAAG